MAAAVAALVLALTVMLSRGAGDRGGDPKQFQPLGFFSTPRSEFWTLTNAIPDSGEWQMTAFGGKTYGPYLKFGDYAKDAFSASGPVTLSFSSSNGGDPLTADVSVTPGNFFMIALYSDQGQNQISFYSFSSGAFLSAVQSGLAVVYFTNFVSNRNMQIFIDGVLFMDLPTHAVGGSPIIRSPVTLQPSQFNSVIELYDVSAPGSAVLAVRGQLSLAAKCVYVCQVMADPNNQDTYPYTITFYKHSLSPGSRPASPTSFALIASLILAVSMSL